MERVVPSPQRAYERLEDKPLHLFIGSSGVPHPISVYLAQ